MLSRRLSRLQDEEGTSMVEVMVGMAMGMVVLAGLSMLLIVTLHGNARINARIEASDNARVTMTRIIEELHSACVRPTIAPIQSASRKNELIFTRGTYGQAANAGQESVETRLVYSEPERILREKDNPGGERILLSNVSPPADGRVFKYSNPTVQPEPFEAEPLGAYAAKTISVTVAFKASPKSEPLSDAGAATEIQNSATLRLTPPLYSSTKVAEPCQ